MIEIIAGTFGYYNGRKVIPITKEDGPQQLDPELEARLVKQGVAKYVDEQPVAPTPAEKPGREPEAAPETGDAPADPEYDEDMKLDELKEVAAAYGVDASAMRKKADVIAAIEEAKAAADEAADDGQSDDCEEPPQIGAADPV